MFFFEISGKMQGINFSVMTTPNRPSDLQENPKRTKRNISLQSLIRKAIREELSDGGKNIDPRKFDTLDTSLI